MEEQSREQAGEVGDPDVDWNMSTTRHSAVSISGTREAYLQPKQAPKTHGRQWLINETSTC